MYLTEEQVTLRENIFFDFVEDIAEEYYEFPEGYEMTEEDAYIASIILEHFVENYRQPSLHDSAVLVLMDRDLNEDLYREILDIMLDESIGTFVAGAAYGIRNALAKHREKNAINTAVKALNKRNVTHKKYKQYANDVYNTKKKTGVSGAAQQGYQQGKQDAMQKKAAAAKAGHEDARKKSFAAIADNKARTKKTQDLASKIDTGIANVKNKVTGAVQSGAKKFGSVLGKVAGKFS
jgi:hypothetical protein